MENKPMIYTAIFQDSVGKLFTSRYTGVVNRAEAWLAAAKMGSSEGNCLVALVPGDHPVYFYENFVTETNASPREHRTFSEQQSHDVYEMT